MRTVDKSIASSINPSDIHPNVAPQLLPHAMGSDVAGKVVQVEQGAGKNCRFEVGDLVYGDIGANTFTRDEKKQKSLVPTQSMLLYWIRKLPWSEQCEPYRSCVASKVSLIIGLLGMEVQETVQS